LANSTDFTAVLFDLDDDEEPDQSVTGADDKANVPEEPTTPRAIAHLKAKSKASKDPPKIGHKAAVPALLTVNLGPSPGALKPKSSLKSSSPATMAESPKTRTVRPGEDKLLELVAANYPSHRAAWMPNGKAWEFFDARRKFANSPDSASMTSSEDSNGVLRTRCLIGLRILMLEVCMRRCEMEQSLLIRNIAPYQDSCRPVGLIC
jgi:hypothetical protein